MPVELGVPERRACRVLGQHRSTQRKPPRTPDDEAALTADIVALATRYGRYGYRRVTALLREAGWAVNRKRVERSRGAALSTAAGGAQGARQAAQEEPALAQRRLLPSAAAGAPEPRLVLRLRRGPDTRRAQAPHARRRRRVRPRVPGDQGGPEPELGRRRRPALGPVHPARHPRPCPPRQRARVRRQGRAGVDRRGRRHDGLHRARQPPSGPPSWP